MLHRTFLESEVKNPVLRKDLYDKMHKLDPNEATPEERVQQAITKLRYMQVSQGSCYLPCYSGADIDKLPYKYM